MSSGSNEGPDEEEIDAVGEVVFLLIGVSFARPTDVELRSKVVRHTKLFGLDASYRFQRS
jgi:hypothetical protein